MIVRRQDRLLRMHQFDYVISVGMAKIIIPVQLSISPARVHADE